MFSSTFLSGGNPLSAMSSAVNKFSLFGDESGQDKQQEAREQKDTKRQQDGVLDTQGPPKESKPQQPGVGMGEAGMGGPQRQDMGKALPPPKGLHGGGAQQQDPPLCPICKNTELNFISKGPPNHNTCTQCKSAVCRLCGFSPPDAATEWLCLNCQMQRAVGGVEPPTPPTKKLPTQPSKGSTPSQPSGKRSPSPAPNKDTPPGKGLSSANQQTKLSDSQKPSGQSCSPIGKRISATTAPASQQTPSQQQTANETPSPVKSKLSTKTDPPVEQSGFFGFGFGSAHGQSRATSPSPQPPVSAVSEKVLGFGSSFFSSASNLISSAVQDEKSTTASKDSTKPLASQAPDEKKTEQKKSEETQPTKATVAQTKNKPTSPQPQKADRSSPKPFPQSCPICKVDLKKDPPNYNTCTECKNIVCTQCGFNPMPHQSEGKDWLCLNCQTQRALQSEGTHLLKPQPQPQDAPTQVKDAGPKQKQTTAQPSKSTSTNKTSTSKEDPRNQNAQQKPPTHQTAKSNLPPQKGVPPQEDSGFFRFGFGGARSRSPSPQPAVSAVSGRVLGFGSSFLSSASNLISSAVQDEPSTTPSTSCKDSTVSQNSASATSTPPASHKESAAAQRAGKETKPSTTLKEEIPGQQNDQQPKTPLTEAKMPELSLYMPKLDKDTQPLPKACPLCKAEFKKDPPNYKICTECKKPVCNLCGFNPMPHQTELIEWLCLNCQTQRAVGHSPVLPKKASVQPHHSGKSDFSTPQKASPKATPPQKDKKAKDIQKLQDQQAKASNGTPPVHKPQQQETEKPQVDASKIKDDSGFFGFGFGGTRARSPSPQPAMSAVSEKVLGFGSSFLSSASNLISAAVQDDASTTPPTSRKGSSVSHIPHKTESAATTPVTSHKAFEPSHDVMETSHPPKSPAQAKRGQEVIKPGTVGRSSQHLPQTCLLCKTEIKKDLSNYSTCTECKNTVCNLCGFNPMPHQTKIQEWLCLSCHTQRASDTSSVLSQSQANKISTNSSSQKMDGAVSEHPQKEKDIPDETIQKGQTAHAVKQPEDTSIPAGEKQVTVTPTANEITQQQPRLQEDTEKSQNQTSKTFKDETPQENSGFFGIGGVCPQSQSPQPAASAVAGNVLDFGSSFLSSASNLISSTVLDEPSTTPPSTQKSSLVSQSCTEITTPPHSSRKGSAVPQTSELSENSEKRQTEMIKPQGEQNKKETIQEEKDTKIHQGKGPFKPEPLKEKESPHALPKDCPLCKVEIKKDPANYSTCTECKTIVCLCCGFNPTPHKTEAKEWVCLNCQMQRAPDPSPVEHQPQDNKLHPPSSPKQKKDTTTKDKDKKALANEKPEGKKDDPEKKQPLGSPATKQATQKEHPKEELPEKDQQTKNETSEPSKSAHSKEETGFLGFSFGTRSRPTSPQPAVAGKVLGFGSSILSSASNLLSSAVQDGPFTTPPPSRKGSTVSQTSDKSLSTPPMSRKGSEVSHISTTTPLTTRKASAQDSPKMNPIKVTKPPNEQNQEKTLQEKKPDDEKLRAPSLSILMDITESDTTKGTEPIQPLSKVCPLCKMELRKDPPNYNICTECKNTVCDLCGFNPMPDHTEVKQWLCLQCQMLQASGPPQLTQPQPIKVPPPVAPQEEGQGQCSVQSPSQLQDLKSPLQQGSEEDTSPPKPIVSQTEPHKDKSAFFGSSQPAVSAVSVKVLGFSSSIISSASNLISSAVQDESSRIAPTSETSVTFPTPATSHKGAAISDASEKVPSNVDAISTQQLQEKKARRKTLEIQSINEPSAQERKDESLSEPLKACPLCTVKFKTDPPNFNTCTFCKSTVCNLCGFNPMPQQSEVKEWLCLNCQIQRVPGPPPVQPQANKAPPPASPQKKETSAPDALQKESNPQTVATYKDQRLSLPAKVEDPLSAKSQEPTSISTSQPSPAKSPPPQKAEPPKKESSFFGFGGPRSQSPSSQPSVSAVPGKVLGFGSSIFSSASNLITSVVQNEPSTTPPTSRKGSIVSQTAVKPESTPPASRKESVLQIPPKPASSAKTNAPDIQKQEENKPANDAPNAQSTKAPSAPVKEDENLSKHPNLCPLCKDKFNEDPPNYNTCSFCKATVCNMCGFNTMPHQTEVKEWLCLNCQMQRAPGSPPSGQLQQMAMKEPPTEMEVSNPDPTQKKTGSAKELNQKPAKPGKPQEELTSVEIQKPSTTLEGKQHSVSAPHTEEQSAVSGKALGFSSSFFSSASNLISSAVQDKSSATPPTTHKDYTFTQSSIKNSPTPPSSHKGSVAHKEEGKHSEVKSEDQLAKTQVSLMEQEPSLLDPPRDCPLCKVDLKKDPPNYNSCTQCKKIVCNLCGFSPIPQQSEVKEWLCLNCQVQRVPDPPPAKLQSHTNKAPPSASPTQKRPSPDPSTSQESSSLSDAKVKNDLLHATGKPEDKPVSAESLKSTPVPSTQPPPSAKPTLPQKAETSKEESGFFGFHLGAARSRPASPQPAVSAVSGKVFGFGSSFLSSASSLISSAVQGESSTTPPTSRKASTVSQTSAENTPTPPTARKGSVLQKQEEKRGLEVKLEDQLSNAPITSVKKEAPLSEPISICPICKGDLKKDQPNYNTCTECKNTVCNLCGFTPVPQHSEVKEWLCLNCQVQRAPDSPPSQFQSHTNKAPPSAPPTQKRETSLVGAPEEKTSLPKDATAKDQKSHMTVKPEDETVSVASQKSTPVPTQQPPLAKSALPQKVERSKNNSGFFGFARSRSPSPQPVVSAVSGKVRGFGSSFLSSASSLISSAVQDDPATTPPTSRKGSVISQTSSKDIPILSTDSKGSVVQIKEEKKKTEITTEDQSKVSPSLVKKDAPLLESPKACPLCKAELKDNLPNYNTCTECKNTVCNLCGFHPMPHETEVEWLCLNCQIKRAPGAKQTTQQAEEGPCPTLPQLAGEPEVGEPEDKPAEEIHTKKPTPPQSPTAESASLPKVEPYKEESGSFGGTHSQPPSSQSADSAISTFVKTTPIPPISQKENLKCVGPEIIPQGEETKTSAEKTKLDEKPFPTDMVADESPSNAAPSKAQHVACPLCMMELNVGLDKATNYKTCTECKNTVCNNCGFNPIPHQTEANEWLCLNCQTQRALKGLEPKGSPVTQPDIVSTSAQQTRTITPISATDACEITETDTVQVKETEVEVSEVEDKTSQKEETHVAWAVEHGPGQMKQFSEELPIMEDQKAAIPQKTVTEQSVSGVMSAMQDEPSITSPHSRKGSTVSQASIKTDTPPTSQKASVKTPPISRKGSTASQASLKMPSTADTKPSVKPDEKSDEESTPSETAKLSEPLQPVPRSRQSNCPICKVDLNIGSEDSPNFNTCTECKNNACVQCGMDTMPYQTKVKKWLCLNCKIQQKIEMEPSGTPIPKPLPTSLEKESQSLPSVPMLAEPKASDPSTCVDEKNIHIPAILKKDVPAINPQQETSAGIKQSDMNPQNKEPQQETNPESAKSQPELTKRTDSLAKSGPPPQSKGPKQDSGFTGLVFGGGKSQPSPPKISDSTSRKLFGLGELAETARSRSPSPKTVTNVSGRFLGFGTSIISSASNLISSAVQDERAASPPTSRKGSTASQSSVKCSTPPPSQNVSKMPPAEPKAPDSKKLNEKKIEEKEIGEPGLAKLLPANAKQEAWPDPAELSATAKAKTNQLLCPLCKVALNVETNDPPNYNTCTQCKNVVCCLCGFNPMPHLSEVEWLCLNCQTQRALQQQMRDTGQNSTSSVRSIEPDPKAQAIKTSVPSQAIEATPGLIISKNESNQQAVTVSSLSVGSAHAAGGPVHTADVPPDKTVDKKPEWKCEIPQPAVKEEKKTEQPAKCDDSSHKSECDDSSQSVMIPPTTTMDTPQEALRTTGVLVEAQHDVKEIYEAPTVATKEVEKVLLNKEVLMQTESTRSTPSELENTLLGAEAHTLKVDEKKDRPGRISPESYSSAEEELKAIQIAGESFIKLVEPNLAVSIKDDLSTKENSSESEQLPFLQRIRSAESSYSEDYKPVSPDFGDEEFIQTQLMEMCMAEGLSPSFEEKNIKELIGENSQQKQYVTRDAAIASPVKVPKITHQTLSVEVEDSSDNIPLCQNEEIEIMQVIHTLDTSEKNTVNISVLNDNEKTEVTDLMSIAVISSQPQFPASQIIEKNSLTESTKHRSKGDESSSIQAPHITPLASPPSDTASPTSLSSLEKESDSSPSQRLDHQLNNLLPVDDICQSEDLWQTSRMKVYESSSFSDISPSIEPESENFLTYQLPPICSSIDAVNDAVEKTLKSAEEIYEEMMQKAEPLKAMTKKVTPPEIEPLYGGMLIEDYAYESLVEEPAMATAAGCSISENVYLSEVIVQEEARKLTTPEEAYVEMQKKRELMLKGKLSEHVQVEKEIARSDFAVHAVTDTCYVIVRENDKYPVYKDEESGLHAEDVLTPKTSPTRSSPLSPISPFSSSEPLYDSPEVVLTLSSGEEDNTKDEYATEHVQYAMEPYIDGSTSPEASLVKKALYPIPDLKITQCSSGEEEAEDEDKTQEYKIAMSNDQSDDNSKEAAKIIMPSPQSNSIEDEPTFRYEIPLSKHVRADVSPIVPPLSPQTLSPDSTTSASSTLLTDQIPESGSISRTPTAARSSTALGADSASFIIVMPAPQVAVVTGPPGKSSFQEISLSQAATSTQQITSTVKCPIPPEVSFSKPPLAPKPPHILDYSSLVSTYTSSTVSINEQNRISFPSHAGIPASLSAAGSVLPAYITASTSISSAQASVPCFTPVPFVQMSDAMSTASECLIHVPSLESLKTPDSTTGDMPSPAFFKVPPPAPVIVQMSDLVASSPQSPVHIANEMLIPAYSSVPATTVSPATDRKSIPPTTVSIPIHYLSPDAEKLSAATATVQALPVTSPAVTDTDGILKSESQILSPDGQTKQGRFVIILPKNTSVINQTTQDIVTNSGMVATSVDETRIQPFVVSVSPVVSTDVAPMEPQVTSVFHERANIPVIEFPPPPVALPSAILADNLPYPAVNQESVPTPSCVRASSPEFFTSMTIAAQSEAVNLSLTAINKSPPPVPPKPVCIPSGLVFSHRSRESIKPPNIAEHALSQTGHAATLPRTKKPPNALSLSLNAPVDSKHNISSPKSPLSPRFSKTLETYVVITLPSEPGSPIESITTQAPVRRSSLPTSAIAPRMFIPPALSEPLVSTQVVAASPKVVLAPAMLTQTAVVPVQTVGTPPVPETAVQTSSTFISVPVIAMPSEVAPASSASALTFVPQTGTFGPPIIDKMTNYAAPSMVTAYGAKRVFSSPLATAGSTILSAPVSATLQIPAPATMVSDSVEPDRQHIQTVCPAPITDHRTIQAIKLGPSSAPVQQHPAFFELQQEAPVVYAKTVMPASALTFAQFTNPPESQELRRPDKVVANMSQMYSAISAEQHPESLPNVVTQMFKTEVQRTTTLSVVQERIPLEPVSDPGSVEIILGPEITKTQIMSKQNGKPHYSGDIIDLTTLKVNVTMTDMGMDLTAPKTSRESLSIDSSGRQATAIKPEIVNLTAEIPPPTTLSVVTDSISIVTCSATIAFNNNIVDKPLNLRSATSKTLPLTTYKRFEPLAQIVYRPVNSQPKPTTSTEIPVNLSCGTTEATAPPSLPSTLLVTVAPVTCINARAGVPIHIEPSLAGAIDLTTSRPKKDMVALSSSSGVVTAVVEDMAPVDLTAGKRTVCCDVLYRLPFTGSCRTQPPATTQPGNQLGSRDDHSKYDNATTLRTEELSKMKASVSNSNFTEIGLFTEGKNEFAYQNGTSEAAIDLTSGKVPADEALDFSKKGTLTFSGITTMQYSQTTSSGVNSVLRSSNGVVYSSVAAPVPSTYAITTQPASIFCTSYNSPSSITDPFSALQNQTLPYDFTHDTGTNQSIFIEPDPSKDTLPSVLANLLPSLTAFPELYSDATLEAIAASLDALVSPNYPTTDDTKSQLYQAEREFLQLEKLKQLCLAEELEWERHEIQRYREQEQIIVQKELEELQSMKQKLLMQQEEERKAHLMLQQETFAQQQLQLEQIHQLQKKLQQQLQEQKMYSYGIETNEGVLQPTTSGILDPQYTIGDNGQYWPVKDDNSILSVVTSHDPVIGQDRHTASSSLPESEAILKDTVDQKQNFKKLPSTAKHISEQNVDLSCKKIAEGNVKTDEEDGVERPYSGRKRRSRRSVDSCVQTDDEDQDEWDVPVRSRRRSRSRYADGERGKGSKVSSIAIQTVAEISVQTDHSGTINRSPVRAQVDTTVDLHKGGQPESDSDVTSEKDKKQSTPVEIGVSTQLKADGIGVTLVHKSPNVLYSPVSPVSPGKGTLKILSAEPSRHPTSPRSLKGSQRSLGSLSDPKSLSPTTDDRIMYQYSDAYSSKGSQNGTTVGFQKKVKRTLPHPPPEDDTIAGPSGYSTGSARRRMCRTTTLARAKILQDIDKELDLVERESSKLRKKQAELDEEEKEIDAKLRYLEMGINRRKEALLKEREKRERAYLQGVAEERDYMSDSEVSNIRGAQGNGHGLERPRTAPQSEFNQFVPPQTEADSQYAHLESPYSHYQYASQTGTTNHYSQQTLYQQQSLYHQQTSPYQTQSVYSSVPTLNQQSQQTGYDHASQLLLMQQKNCQTTLSELETKINTNYEVIRNQPLLIVPTSTDYGVSHLGGKYSNLELRMGLEERGSMASSPMSSISAESFYADIDHHNARNYVMIDDIGELTKSSPGLGSSFNIPDKDMSKTDRLLRAAEVRRTADVADFLGPLQAASRLHSYGKPEEDSMEEPYELKLLQQQIKQEFRRGTDGLEQLTGLPHYLHSDSFRHFPKSEKYSIGRLTLEKQAAKQLPASVLYQKQLKNKRALIDPKITKFSPIQETRDLEPDYSSFLASTGSAMGGLSSRARLLQDEITFGLRKNIAEQQKYLGSSLSTNLAQSLNLGQSLNLSQSLRTSLQEDGTYPSVTRSRPSSRPSSAYGLDLSIKRDLSSSSLRLKAEGEGMDSQFGAARAKPTSLPISQSRGRIPIVAQNSEEESPLSPVGQPMGMARASAGPLPPISADSRDQFGSSHSLPEVQQHMREESRTRGYDRDIAFIMDDLQGAMSDSEAYHLQHEETDWFDKPREEREGQDRRRIKAIHYPFPHTRIKLQKDPKDHTVSGSGFGIRVVGGKEIPGTNGEIGAYIAKVLPGGTAEHTGKIVEGMQVLEWSGIPLIAKTYEEVQSIVGQQNGEAEICVRLDLNMLSDSEHHQQLELHPQFKTSKSSERQRSPGVDPKQLAAELQKVSQQQAPASVLAVLEKAGHLHSATTSDASSGVPSPGQPGSPSVNKKRHSSKSAEALKQQPHPISGEIQLQINYDKNMGNLIVHVLQARNLSPRDNNGYSDPFVKVYLLPGRGAENKRRTKYVQKTQNPEWNQTVIYKNIHLEQLKRKTLEVTVWDYDRYSSNDFLGEVLIDLSNTAQLDNMPRWHPLKEQSESIHHGRGLAPQGGAGAGSQGGQGGSGGSAGPGGTAGQPSNDQSPKTSVIKSRSHGIFPDPAKDTQVPTIEKSHSSPGSSKSSSEGHLRSRGPSRSQSKSSVTQTHLEEAGNAIAAAEAAVQQGRLQPNRATHRLSNGDGYTLDSEDGTDTNAVDSAIFQVPQLKTIPNGLDKRGSDSLLNLPDSEVKNQIMGEIKVALKKEMKTEGEQLVLEILQCRNITYKFKSPDHLPDLYVKLYVVNVATQKRIIKKKTRVCRHDREPSFNETFRFSLNPTGHSIQLFLVSNGGKFVKKTLIGEAYIWLDKVDMRKRAVSWHELVASSPHTQP